MYLGLDLGTSGLKGLLIDSDQKIIGSANAPLTVTRPHDGWSEQDPDSWITAAEQVLDHLSQHFPKQMQSLHGIGLSGHMHGATLIDKNAKPIRPCIMWNDTRSQKQATHLDAMDGTRDLAGSIIFPGFTSPKLLWVKENEPELFARIYKVLLPKDALRLWLTGDYISEQSDSSGTGWLDVAKRNWSEALLNTTNLSRDHMPNLVEGSDPGGQLRTTLAARWNLPHGITVAGGAGDNAAAAIGMGVVKEGQAFLSLGTSGVLFAANNEFLPKPESTVHAFCHALPDKWHQMGVILAATDALEWFGKITGASAHELTRALGDELQAPGGTQFLPYLGGERTPHNDAATRGAFVQLSHNDDRAALTRAMLEGVAFAFRDNLEALQSAGTKVERVLAVGGGSKSSYWLKVISTALGLPVEVPADGEFGAAFGAARLGLLAANGVEPESICTPRPLPTPLNPTKL